MARRIRYNIGDVFFIPLDENLNGVGRVLKKKNATVLVELYRMKPIVEKVDFDFNKVQNCKPISTSWCYDTALKNGNWEIIDNYPVEYELGQLYFWTQDAGNNKYYLVEGTDSFSDKFTGIEISEDDRSNYDSYGIGGETFMAAIYRKGLTSVGLL